MKISIIGLLTLFLVACGGYTHKPDYAPSKPLKKPGYIADAVPRVEPKSKGGNPSTYTVRGKTYRVLSEANGYKERGIASWYGMKFHGNLTSNGERYDIYKMTAAHKHLPLPSYVRVTNIENGKQAIVRVNDRGPFIEGRIIDLSYLAATKLDIVKKGTAKVEVEVIDPRTYRKAKTAPQTTKTRLAVNNKNKSYEKNKQQLITKSRSEGNLYLQIAAFTSLASAQRMQNDLLEKINRAVKVGNLSLNPKVVIHPLPERGLYRVRVGPFKNQNKVNQLKNNSLFHSFANAHTTVLNLD